MQHPGLKLLPVVTYDGTFFRRRRACREEAYLDTASQRLPKSIAKGLGFSCRSFDSPTIMSGVGGSDVA